MLTDSLPQNLEETLCQIRALSVALGAPIRLPVADWMSRYSTKFIPLGALPSCMSLEETVDYLAEELDLERSGHVREVGQSVAQLRD